MHCFGEGMCFFCEGTWKITRDRKNIQCFFYAHIRDSITYANMSFKIIYCHIYCPRDCITDHIVFYHYHQILSWSSCSLEIYGFNCDHVPSGSHHGNAKWLQGYMKKLRGNAKYCGEEKAIFMRKRDHGERTQWSNSLTEFCIPLQSLRSLSKIIARACDDRKWTQK